ncbi:MAG: hypothetical protein V3U54_13260 [Thermodesulfobacteriota bacterium]
MSRSIQHLKQTRKKLAPVILAFIDCKVKTFPKLIDVALTKTKRKEIFVEVLAEQGGKNRDRREIYMYNRNVARNKYFVSDKDHERLEGCNLVTFDVTDHSEAEMIGDFADCFNPHIQKELGHYHWNILLKRTIEKINKWAGFDLPDDATKILKN